MSRIIHTLAFTLILMLCSCGSDEGDALRAKLSETTEPTSMKSGEIDATTLMEYKEKEIVLNNKYVEDMQALLENDFEEKLEEFEDEELGFWASYKHMFMVVFESKQEIQDYWIAKKQKYFSTINTEQKMHELYLDYRKDVEMLRKHVATAVTADRNETEAVTVNLPKEDISIAKMTENAYINLLIEFGGEKVFVWLLVFILSIATGGAISKNGIVAIIFGILASIFTSMWNDSRVIKSLREQHQEAVFDYSSLKHRLNTNTEAFYENL